MYMFLLNELQPDFRQIESSLHHKYTCKKIRHIRKLSELIYIENGDTFIYVILIESIAPLVILLSNNFNLKDYLIILNN